MLTNMLKIQLLVLFIVGAAVSVTAQDQPLKEALRSMGYTIKGRSTPALRDWEIRDLKMEGKEVLVVQEVRKRAFDEVFLHRFTVTIEKYNDVADATTRTEHLRESPPGPHNIRKGFLWRSKVFVVSAASYKYVEDGSLHKFTDDLDWKLWKVE